MLTDDAIIACAACDRVIIDTTIDRIVARATINLIGIIARRDDIVARAAKDSIKAICGVWISQDIREARNRQVGIVANIIGEGVCARFDSVVAVTTYDKVGALDVDNAVVAFVAEDLVIVNARKDRVVTCATCDGVTVVACADDIIPCTATYVVTVIFRIGIHWQTREDLFVNERIRA